MVFGGCEGEGGGKVVGGDVGGRVGEKGVVEVGVFVLEEGEVMLGLVGVWVINEDKVKLGIMVVEERFEVRGEVLGLLRWGDDEGEGGEVVGEV